MKKIITKVLMVGIFLLSITSLSYADNIGYVDMQKVFMSYSETKKAQKSFNKKQEALKKEFEKSQKKIEAAKKKGKSEDDIKKLVEKLEKELKPKQEELVQLNAQLMAKIRMDILDAVKNVSKEYGVDVVFAKKVRDFDLVLHGGFDLTDFVTQKLD